MNKYFVLESYYTRGSKAYYEFDTLVCGCATLLTLNGVQVSTITTKTGKTKPNKDDAFLNAYKRHVCRCISSYNTDSIQLDRYGKIWLSVDTIEQVDEWFEANKIKIAKARLSQNEPDVYKVRAFSGGTYGKDKILVPSKQNRELENITLNAFASRGSFGCKMDNPFSDDWGSGEGNLTQNDIEYLENHRDDFRQFYKEVFKSDKRPKLVNSFLEIFKEYPVGSKEGGEY